MSFKDLKDEFEAALPSLGLERHILTFHGAEGLSVYNCSIPFELDGKTYIFGRIERANEWANSWVRLFERIGEDEYTVSWKHMVYPLEDPFIAYVQGELVLGGTHVRKKKSQIENLYCYFYRGKSLDDLTYFTTGPDLMKDVRLIDLQNGKIGVFSRPRSLEVRNKYGSDALIGFTTINSLDELDAEAISSATPIDGLFAVGEWGGCNQAYLLENGNIGIIGHHGYRIDADDGTLLKAVYSNTAFELNPETREVPFYKIIGTRSCFPPAPPKFPMLSDCTFTSGIVLREDGKADLYAGIGDTQEGRLVIEYPFSSPVRPAAGIA